MSEHVRYIDRTREYYLGQGYDKPYAWAHNTDAPFTPLTKPLSECRVAIVSTSDIAIQGPDGTRDRSHEFAVGNVYSLPSDTPIELLYSRQEHYDQHATTLDDVNAYYPRPASRSWLSGVGSGRWRPATTASTPGTRNVRRPRLMRPRCCGAVSRTRSTWR